MDQCNQCRYLSSGIWYDLAAVACYIWHFTPNKKSGLNLDFPMQ